MNEKYYKTIYSSWVWGLGGGGGGGGEAGVPIYGIVRMCVPNGSLFQC